MHAFESAARLSSINAAAAELRLTPSAISHQVKALERYLGVALFRRAHRAIFLTDAGTVFLQLASGALDRVEHAAKVVIERGYADILTVHCAPTFAPAWLMPRLADFLASYPDVDVRLHATPDLSDFVHSDVDIEIRYGTGDWPGLYVVPLIAERITPLLSPRLAGRARRRMTASEVAKLPLIHSERSLLSWTAWFDAHHVTNYNVARGLRFDRGYLSVQAAVDGLGVALESTVFAERDLDRGALVAPFLEREDTRPVSAHYLVCPLQHLRLTKVRRFHDWIVRMARESDEAQRLARTHRSRKR